MRRTKEEYERPQEKNNAMFCQKKWVVRIQNNKISSILIFIHMLGKGSLFAETREKMCFVEHVFLFMV